MYTKHLLYFFFIFMKSILFYDVQKTQIDDSIMTTEYFKKHLHKTKTKM